MYRETHGKLKICMGSSFWIHLIPLNIVHMCCLPKHRIQWFPVKRAFAGSKSLIETRKPQSADSLLQKHGYCFRFSTGNDSYYGIESNQVPTILSHYATVIVMKECSWCTPHCTRSSQVARARVKMCWDAALYGGQSAVDNSRMFFPFLMPLRLSGHLEQCRVNASDRATVYRANAEGLSSGLAENVPNGTLSILALGPTSIGALGSDFSHSIFH